MKWTIDFSKTAKEELKHLDKPIRERIRNFIKRLQELPNPRIKGEALMGNLSEFWKYHVGDYRLICRIQDEKLIVVVVKVGHRMEVYKNK